MLDLGMSPSLLRGLSILASASLLLVAAPASADVQLAPLVVIDLSTFEGNGFNPAPGEGQLDTDDWAVRLNLDPVSPFEVDFGGTAEGAGYFARGSSMGDVDDPGIWAFDVDGAGLIALGVQPSDSAFTPGQIVLRLVNNTGADIAEFQVEYTVWVNNNANRSNYLNFAQSPDDTAYVPVGDPFLSPEAPDREGFVATDLIQLVTPEAAIADGAQYYVAWEGNDGAGDSSRDEFGIEGITIRLLDMCGNGLIEGDETCDDGPANSDTGACLATCATAACGDGFVQDGVEECDDMNPDDGDGCSGDCTVEVAGTGTTTATGGTGVDSTDGDGDSDGDSGSASADSTEGGATNATNATSPDDDGSESEDTGAEDDDTSSCSCHNSGGPAPIWGMLGLLGLGRARRRRR